MREPNTRLSPMGIWGYMDTWKKLERQSIKLKKSHTCILQDRLKEAYSHYTHKRMVNDNIQTIQSIIKRISEEYCENEFVGSMITQYERIFIQKESDLVQNIFLCYSPKSKKKVKKSFRLTKNEKRQLRQLQQMMFLPNQADAVALLFEPKDTDCNAEFISQLCFLQSITDYINQKNKDISLYEEVNALWESAYKI